MATRTVAPQAEALTALEVFTALVELGSTEDNKTSIRDLEMEMAEPSFAILPVLDVLEEAKLIDVEGLGAQVSAWLTVDATPENAAEIVAEALSGVVEETPKPKARKSAAQVFKPAPDALPKGTEVTMSDGSKGTVISDEVVTIPAAKPVENWQVPEFESVIPDFDGPETIPNPPKGVSPNFWYMSFYANTATARKFWADKVAEQITTADAA